MIRSKKHGTIFGTTWKKRMKRTTVKKHRSRPLTDETKYKRLDDPWNYT